MHCLTKIHPTSLLSKESSIHIYIEEEDTVLSSWTKNPMKWLELAYTQLEPEHPVSSEQNSAN